MRPDYANAYKLAMLTNYGLELQELGDSWFGELDQGNKMYRQIYIHAVIGYLETGSLLGLVGEEQGKIIKDVYKRQGYRRRPKVPSEWSETIRRVQRQKGA